MTTITMYAPSYLPWKGLFDRVKQSDIFVITDTDRLSRKDFHTRNRIVSPTGPFWLTIPVKGRRAQPLTHVEIDNSQPWWRKHWTGILYSYKNAPYFQPDLEAYYRYRTNKPLPRSLVEFNLRLIHWLLLSYDLHVPVYKASDLHVYGAGSERILNICRHFGADKYLCGSNGPDYLDLPAFHHAGIEVEAQPWPGQPVSALHDLFTEGPQL